MTPEFGQKTLLQLKMDYLQFMEQINHSSFAIDPNQTGVLFALLMENDYLTQEQLIELTGFSRTTISETISELSNVTSKYPVLQTRKPRDKKKYYYCPLDIEQYIRTFF